MGLNDYTLEELDAMLDNADEIGLSDYPVYEAIQSHYDARYAAKFLFLDLFDGVE